jgi:hypothetical protein
MTCNQHYIRDYNCYLTWHPTPTKFADARMMGFEVLPEVTAQLLGKGCPGSGGPARLPFVQVLDQQVAYRPTGHLVAVDQLGRAALPDGQQLGERAQCVRAEDTGLAQQPT